MILLVGRRRDPPVLVQQVMTLQGMSPASLRWESGPRIFGDPPWKADRRQFIAVPARDERTPGELAPRRRG